MKCLGDSKRRTINLLGVFQMSFDWVPGAGISLAGNLLLMWRGSGIVNAVVTEKVAESDRRFNELKAQTEKALADNKREMELVEDSVHGEITAAVHQLNDVATLLKTTIAESNAYTQVNTKALDGLITRVERLQELAYQHDRELAVVKAQMKVSAA